MSKICKLKAVIVHIFWVLFMTATAHAQPYQDAMFSSQEQQSGGDIESSGIKIWITLISVGALFIILYFYKTKRLSGKNDEHPKK